MLALLQEFRISKMKTQHENMVISGKRLVRRGRLTAALEYIQLRVDAEIAPNMQMHDIFNPSWQAKQKATGSIR